MNHAQPPHDTAAVVPRYSSSFFPKVTGVGTVFFPSGGVRLAATSRPRGLRTPVLCLIVDADDAGKGVEGRREGEAGELSQGKAV